MSGRRRLLVDRSRFIPAGRSTDNHTIPPVRGEQVRRIHAIHEHVARLPRMVTHDATD
jgi:hypothetical protein